MLEGHSGLSECRLRAELSHLRHLPPTRQLPPARRGSHCVYRILEVIPSPVAMAQVPRRLHLLHVHPIRSSSFRPIQVVLTGVCSRKHLHLS